MTRGTVRPRRTDVVVIGSGFAGTLTAMALRRCGRSVLLLERGRHPRVTIGESSTPLANLLLAQLCDRYELDTIRPLASWGSWQQAHPDIACGLKRGFSFFHHCPGVPFEDDRTHARQLLVAASPHDAIADTHWYRADVDAFLVEQAERTGVVYLDQVRLDAMCEHADGASLTGRFRNEPFSAETRFVVDASGPRGALHRLLGLRERALQWLPCTQALYAHFTQAQTWESVTSAAVKDTPPFPVDAAALHHVFPGGWMWVLRFNHGVVSAGVAMTDSLASELNLAEGASAWTRLLQRYPSIGRQFEFAQPVTPFTYVPRLAFRSVETVGRTWALLPSAAGIIDPLLSTGFPLTLLGVQRLVDVLSGHWDDPSRAARLETYARQTQQELDATERLVAALYASMADPELFKRLALLYFAAASFSETMRRLGREDAATGFLLHDDAVFGPGLRACTDEALAQPTGAQRAALLNLIDDTIAPFDVAGLGDRSRRDWYPLLASDLQRAAPRLGITQQDVALLLERTGFLTCAG